jgi:hypothetical protein
MGDPTPLLTVKPPLATRRGAWLAWAGALNGRQKKRTGKHEFFGGFERPKIGA